MHYGQTGVVRERDVDSCGFDIRGGVRQGCVLGHRLFSAVLEMALSSWRAKMEAERLSFEDGLTPLLDLRFCSDRCLRAGNVSFSPNSLLLGFLMQL